MKLFHGTTFNKLRKILTDGYLGTYASLWEVSEPNMTYFYGEDLVKKEYEENWYEEGIRMAIENGEIGLGLEEHDLRRVCLVFDSRDLNKLNEGRVAPDISCGKDMMESYQFYGKIPISLIKEVWIDKEKLDLFRIYFIGMIQSINNHRNSQIQADLEKIPSEFLKVAEKAYEDLSEFFMENYIAPEVLEKKTLSQMLIEIFGKTSLEQWIKRD
jgi:hypothetical protein